MLALQNNKSFVFNCKPTHLLLCPSDNLSDWRNKSRAKCGKWEGYAFVTGAGQVITTEKMNGKPCSLVHCFLAAVLTQSKFNLSAPRQRWGKLAHVTYSNAKSTPKQMWYISSLWKNKSLRWWKCLCSTLETFMSIMLISIPQHKQVTAIMSPLLLIMYNDNYILTADCSTHCFSYLRSNLVYVQLS